MLSSTEIHVSGLSPISTSYGEGLIAKQIGPCLGTTVNRRSGRRDDYRYADMIGCVISENSVVVVTDGLDAATTLQTLEPKPHESTLKEPGKLTRNFDFVSKRQTSDFGDSSSENVEIAASFSQARSSIDFSSQKAPQESSNAARDKLQRQDIGLHRPPEGRSRRGSAAKSNLMGDVSDGHVEFLPDENKRKFITAEEPFQCEGGRRRRSLDVCDPTQRTLRVALSPINTAKSTSDQVLRRHASSEAHYAGREKGSSWLQADSNFALQSPGFADCRRNTAASPNALLPTLDCSSEKQTALTTLEISDANNALPLNLQPLDCEVSIARCMLPVQRTTISGQAHYSDSIEWVQSAERTRGISDDIVSPNGVSARHLWPKRADKRVGKFETSKDSGLSIRADDHIASPGGIFSRLRQGYRTEKKSIPPSSARFSPVSESSPRKANSRDEICLTDRPPDFNGSGFIPGPNDEDAGRDSLASYTKNFKFFGRREALEREKKNSVPLPGLPPESGRKLRAGGEHNTHSYGQRVTRRFSTSNTSKELHTEMGQALACCGAREDGKTDPWNFMAGGKRVSDLELFDNAYATEDIPGFLKLISSKQPFTKKDDQMHPWAANPASVGALATTQIAVLASTDDAELKDRIRKAGAISILVEELGSSQPDRVHAALVALSFLSVDSPRACVDMFEGKVLPKLVGLMGAPLDGLRAAAAQTARNVYVLDVQYRREFKTCGGGPALVKMLELPKGNFDPNKLFTQLEAIYHIEDYILDSSEEIAEFVSDIKAAGAGRALEKLETVKNADIADSAHYLYLRIAD